MSRSPRFVIIFIPLVLWIGVLPASALENETVRIPLALSEQYLAGSRIVALDFDSGQALPEIVDVRLFVTGNYCCFEVIFADCHGPPGGNFCYDPGLEFGFLEADGKVFPTVNVIPGVYDNSVQPDICEQQDLAAEIAFDYGSAAPDWSFLADGSGTVYLTGLEEPIFCAYPVCCYFGASFYITSAELIVEIPAPTPVEEHSWGTIKAIYR